jgi:pimeloyl-ACP methyl ester carboxylesterase
MHETSAGVPSESKELSATLSHPRGIVRAGLIPLHPANASSKDQWLFRHLARTANRLGVAVLRFDRRARRAGQDVPLADQATDALSAIRCLREGVGDPQLPVGLWGWSQGAWAAPLAAARSEQVRFLILIASTGVSPGVQMRYGTDEHLRMAGFGRKARAELLELRLAYEDAIRRTASRSSVQNVVDRCASEPWFPLASVPRHLPRRLEWRDMDFDPKPIFEKVRVPTLLFYGASDEWSPIRTSISVWREAQTVSGNRNLMIRRLRGTTHAPTLGGKRTIGAISPEYTRTMEIWLGQILPRL